MVTVTAVGGSTVCGLATDTLTLKVPSSSSTESPNMVTGWHPTELPVGDSGMVSI